MATKTTKKVKTVKTPAKAVRRSKKAVAEEKIVSAPVEVKPAEKPVTVKKPRVKKPKPFYPKKTWQYAKHEKPSIWNTIRQLLGLKEEQVYLPGILGTTGWALVLEEIKFA